MLAACKLLGAQIHPRNTGVEIIGTGGVLHTPKEAIDAGNSGIVLRFISAIAALGSVPVTITGDHSIQNQRPMQTMLDALSMLGVSAKSARQNGFAPLTIQGPLTQGKTSIDGKDSQPVSSLLILGAFSPIPLEIEVSNPGEIPWIRLTLDWLDFLGVPYENDGFHSYKIGGGPQIKGFHYTVPGDMSSAAFSVTSAVINKTPLIVKGLDFADRQGDKLYFEILQKMGAKLVINRDARTIEILPGSELKGITADINDCIDAICALAVAACFAEGETNIINASIARTKECNRIDALVKELSKMGANIEETTDGLKIKKSELHGAEVWGHNDHRMAMSLAVAAMAANGSTVIKGSECIRKTYPTFIHDFSALGAKFNEYPA
jgi:3-phosphoshikimate 1-carboxyvinyltransferase